MVFGRPFASAAVVAAQARVSPDDWRGIHGKYPVLAHDGAAFRQGLRDEHPVKRVFVMRRQRIQLKHMLHLYWQYCQTVLLNLVADKLPEGFQG